MNQLAPYWPYLALFVVVGYLIGGINPAIILSRAVYHEDIREKGSKNPGFTNFKRVYGNHFISWSVMFLDIFKTVVPVCAAFIFFSFFAGVPHFASAVTGLACMLGHCWPVWYGFKGGKAFMAGFANIWFVDWRMALVAVAVFLIVLGIGKIMSLSSMCGALSCPVTLALIGVFEHSFSDTVFIFTLVFCAASALLVIFRHWPNIVRLAHGTESKFSLHK